MSPERGRQAKVLAGYALAVAAVLFAARYLGVNAGAFLEGMKAVDPLAAMLALVLFLLHVVVNAISFAWLNHAGGVHLPATKLGQAWAVSLFAKYVPGGVWHVVGRGLLLNRLGVPVRFSGWMGLVEQAISLSICLTAAAVFFLLGEGEALLGLLCALLGIGGILVAGRVAILQLLGSVSWRPWCQAVLGYSLAMVPYAFGYLVLTRPGDGIQFVSALFLGTLAGVLALPVPGGIGVREAGVTLLAAPGGAGALMGAMVFARLLILAAESMAGGIGLILNRVPKDRS